MNQMEYRRIELLMLNQPSNLQLSDFSLYSLLKKEINLSNQSSINGNEVINELLNNGVLKCNNRSGRNTYIITPVEEAFNGVINRYLESINLRALVPETSQLINQKRLLSTLKKEQASLIVSYKSSFNQKQSKKVTEEQEELRGKIVDLSIKISALVIETKKSNSESMTQSDYKAIKFIADFIKPTELRNASDELISELGGNESVINCLINYGVLYRKDSLLIKIEQPSVYSLRLITKIKTELDKFDSKK
jgi:hypothetical protein